MAPTLEETWRKDHHYEDNNCNLCQLDQTWTTVLRVTGEIYFTFEFSGCLLSYRWEEGNSKVKNGNSRPESGGREAGGGGRVSFWDHFGKTNEKIPEK